MESILYIAHGTRSKEGAQEAKNFLKHVMEKVSKPIQEYSFLELTEPSIEEGFARCVAKGAKKVIMVPLFLLSAGHVKKDIPTIIRSLKKRYPEINIILKDAFGVHEGIIDGIGEMVYEKLGKICKDDALLIVGRGSSDPTIQLAFSEIGERIKNKLGVHHLSVCYLACAKPTLHEGFEWAIKTANRRIIVIPYLLFSGLLFSEVQEKVRLLEKKGWEIALLAPLSNHPTIENVVIQCAVGEGTTDAAAYD